VPPVLPAQTTHGERLQVLLKDHDVRRYPETLGHPEQHRSLHLPRTQPVKDVEHELRPILTPRQVISTGQLDERNRNRRAIAVAHLYLVKVHREEVVTQGTMPILVLLRKEQLVLTLDLLRHQKEGLQVLGRPMCPPTNLLERYVAVIAIIALGEPTFIRLLASTRPEDDIVRPDLL